MKDMSYKGSNHGLLLLKGSSGPPLSVDDGLSHLSPTLVDTSHVEGRITKVVEYSYFVFPL